MKKMFLLLMIIFALQLSAIRVTGRVIDIAGNGISDVSVAVGEYAVFTNHNGFFQLEGIKHSQRVFIHKIGYKDIYLMPENVGLQIILEQQLIEVPGFTIEGKQENPATLTGSDKLIIKNEDQSAGTAAELLKDQVAINLKGSELLGSKRTISIGGNKGKHTLIMLDGVALNMNGEDFDIASIPAAIIDRIEILPNNAGAIGGSGAIGGIVNIITREKLVNKSGDKKKVYLSSSNNLKVGSFGLMKWQTQVSTTFPWLQAFTTYSQAQSDNDFTYFNKITQEEESRENNRSEIEDFTLMLNARYKQITAKYNLIYQDYYKELPSSINVLTLFDNCHKLGYISKQFIDLNYNQNKYSFNAKYYWNGDISDYDNTKSSGYVKQASSTDFYKNGASLEGTYLWERVINLRFGGDYDKQKFSFQDKIKPIPGVNKVMENYALRGAIEAKFSLYPVDYEFTFHSRFDIPQKTEDIDFEAELTNRLDYQLAYRNWFELVLGGSWGNSYQLPSFYDLHWMEGSQAIGNPDLLPEKSQGWSFFYKLEVAKSFIKFSYQYNEVEELIRWYRSLYFWKPGNIGSAEISNYQIQTEFALPKKIKANFSWQRTFSINKTVTDEGLQSDHYNKNLTYTPTSNTNVSMEIPWYNFSWKSSYSRVGRQWTTDDNLFPAIAAYSLIDTKIIYKYTHNRWSISTDVGANNILDEEYDTTTLIPNPGRNWSSNVNLEFRF